MFRRRRQRQQRPRAICGEAGLVMALVLALLAAPAVSALRSECDSCPPDCPMHHHQGSIPNGPHLGCHHVAGAAAPRLPTGRSVVGCASCGNHSLLSDTSLPPMLLAVNHPLSISPVARAVRIPDSASNSLGFDPPDTPPPIVHASVA